MIRYELEKRVMHGELEVKDLPAEWNRMYKEYLGIDVPDDKRGVLQDSHWASGLFGYFPSYALGNAYGAQFLAKMRETVDVDACIANGDFAPVNEWNREHIWKHGARFKPSEILDRVFEEEFDPGYYIDYLEKKYTELYGL
jgi:carboxypeptidase Taq